MKGSGSNDISPHVVKMCADTLDRLLLSDSQIVMRKANAKEMGKSKLYTCL